MRKGRYQVTREFTVFRQPHKTPKQLKARFRFYAHEPIHETVILESGSERFESAKRDFLAHTIAIRTSLD